MTKRVIDISGRNGNAFALIGQAQTFGKQIGMNRDELKELAQEMMSGDYPHLLEVFNKHFGKVVELRFSTIEDDEDEYWDDEDEEYFEEED